MEKIRVPAILELSKVSQLSEINQMNRLNMDFTPMCFLPVIEKHCL